MNYKEDPLWQRIEAFKLDEDGAQHPFKQKLLQENNWPPQFADRAITEYKKFIYLCIVFPHGASPSPIVDQVWHLHLTYTKNYWYDFCQNTLQVNIHHNPSKGGEDEYRKHREWYDKTLKDYVTVFHTAPPEDIWAKPKLHIPRHESLFKSPLKTGLTVGAAVITLFTVPTLFFFIVFWVIVYELSRFTNPYSKKRSGDGNWSGNGCSESTCTGDGWNFSDGGSDGGGGSCGSSCSSCGGCGGCGGD